MDSTISSKESIALLIDADNAPAARIDFIIAELATYGVVNIRRAYGNWKKPTLSGWEKVLHEYAIQPVNVQDGLVLVVAAERLSAQLFGTSVAGGAAADTSADSQRQVA